MPYDQRVKDRARELDPECWRSYSDQPRPVKQRMETRRNITLAAAAEELDAKPCGCIGTERCYLAPQPLGHCATRQLGHLVTKK